MSKNEQNPKFSLSKYLAQRREIKLTVAPKTKEQKTPLELLDNFAQEVNEWLQQPQIRVSRNALISGIASTLDLMENVEQKIITMESDPAYDPAYYKAHYRGPIIEVGNFIPKKIADINDAHDQLGVSKKGRFKHWKNYTKHTIDPLSQVLSKSIKAKDVSERELGKHIAVKGMEILSDLTLEYQHIFQVFFRSQAYYDDVIGMDHHEIELPISKDWFPGKQGVLMAQEWNTSLFEQMLQKMYLGKQFATVQKLLSADPNARQELVKMYFIGFSTGSNIVFRRKCLEALFSIAATPPDYEKVSINDDGEMSELPVDPAGELALTLLATVHDQFNGTQWRSRWVESIGIFDYHVTREEATRYLQLLYEGKFLKWSIRNGLRRHDIGNWRDLKNHHYQLLPGEREARYALWKYLSRAWKPHNQFNVSSGRLSQLSTTIDEKGDGNTFKVIPGQNEMNGKQIS